jgi:hypothetical protein
MPPGRDPGSRPARLAPNVPSAPTDLAGQDARRARRVGEAVVRDLRRRAVDRRATPQLLVVGASHYGRRGELGGGVRAVASRDLVEQDVNDQFPRVTVAVGGRPSRPPAGNPRQRIPGQHEQPQVPRHPLLGRRQLRPADGGQFEQSAFAHRRRSEQVRQLVSHVGRVGHGEPQPTPPRAGRPLHQRVCSIRGAA